MPSVSSSLVAPLETVLIEPRHETAPAESRDKAARKRAESVRVSGFTHDVVSVEARFRAGVTLFRQADSLCVSSNFAATADDCVTASGDDSIPPSESINRMVSADAKFCPAMHSLVLVPTAATPADCLPRAAAGVSTTSVGVTSSCVAEASSVGLSSWQLLRTGELHLRPINGVATSCIDAECLRRTGDASSTRLQSCK